MSLVVSEKLVSVDTVPAQSLEELSTVSPKEVIGVDSVSLATLEEVVLTVSRL